MNSFFFFFLEAPAFFTMLWGNVSLSFTGDLQCWYTSEQTSLWFIWGRTGGVNSAPIKFVLALDAYEELIQIREEGVANYLFFSSLLLVINRRTSPSSVCEPAGERKLLPSKHCWQ